MENGFVVWVEDGNVVEDETDPKPLRVVTPKEGPEVISAYPISLSYILLKRLKYL